jgi:FdhD protein
VSLFGPKPFSVSEPVSGQRWEGAVERPAKDVIANETPVALVYNDVPHVVMMATPADIEDFVLGFSLSEGILHDASEFRGVKLRTLKDGIEADIEIAEPRFRELEFKQRNLTGRVGCGLCGAQTLAQAVRHPKKVADTLRIQPQAIERALSGLAAKQELNAATGAVHAAAWADANGEIQLLREDVGRHNALDKLIGAMINARMDFNAGALIITSRASYEMIQKAATLGIQMVCAISAPTALAVRMAEETGVTLIAFARGNRHTVYANTGRINPSAHSEAA